MTTKTIFNADIYSIDSRFSVYKNASMVISDNQLDAGKREGVVLPGLIDAHFHSSLLKGA